MDLESLGALILFIGGALSVGKTLLDILKAGQENREILSRLWRSPWAWLGAILLLAGIGALWWDTSNRPYTVRVLVWDVALDDKGSVIASGSFSGRTSASLSQAEATEIGGWFEEQIRQKYGLTDDLVKAKIYIPSDLSQNKVKIDMIPTGGYKLYVTQTAPGVGKLRSIVIGNDLSHVVGDFELEVQRPGYEVKSLSVNREELQQHAMTQTLTLGSVPVQIGIENFTGADNSLASALIAYFAGRRGFTVKDPGTLASLREQIQRDKAELAKFPFMQMGVRTTLGVDFIINGTYEVREP